MKINIDTIAAIATPAGDGGLAVLRVSGPDAFVIGDRTFRGRVRLSESRTHTAHVGHMIDEAGDRVDRVVCTTFKRPHSYTGEDTVEVSCHGGHLVARRILEVLISAGARAATPGEFTKRAFLNGRMDLAQAEAVADLIEAQSDLGRRASLGQLEGGLSARLGSIRLQLLDTLASLELELDFSEEGYEFVDHEKLAGALHLLTNEVDRLIKSYSLGRVFREGVRVAIVGAPNAGKSSLLNALLRESRAIVTNVPGTTRDVITESLLIDGILFRVADTAGLRHTEDPVEAEGVRRAREEMEGADLLVWVIDSTRGARHQAQEMDTWTRGALSHRQEKVIVALSKSDIVTEEARVNQLPQVSVGPSSIVRVSATEGTGIRELESKMVAASIGGSSADRPEGPVITNARHYTALLRTMQALENTAKGLKEGATSEFLALDIRGAIEALGEITGEVTTEDILNTIFSRFCIGK